MLGAELREQFSGTRTSPAKDQEAILALLMAYHPRLGAKSSVRKIPKPLVVKIYGFMRRKSPFLVSMRLDHYFRQGDPEAWDELVLQILVAAKNEEKTLTLATKSLASIPSCIGRCTELEKLVLMGVGLVTLPPQIGKLYKLSRLQTYCCHALFYPFELLNCKKLYVHGDSLYIDLNSLLGRRARKFPSIPSATEACSLSPQADLSSQDTTLDGSIDVAPCSWCQTNWPSSEYTSWMQGRFPGGDRRDVLPLLGRFCSQTCLSAAQEKHTPSQQELSHAKMESCRPPKQELFKVEVSPFDRLCPKETACSNILQITQSNS